MCVWGGGGGGANTYYCKHSFKVILENENTDIPAFIFDESSHFQSRDQDAEIYEKSRLVTILECYLAILNV